MFCIVHKNKHGELAVLDTEDYIINYITEHELEDLKVRGFKFINEPRLEKCATLYFDLVKERTLKSGFDGSTYKFVFDILSEYKRYARGMHLPNCLYNYDCRLIPVDKGFLFKMTAFEASATKDYLFTIREDGIFWLEDWRVPNNSIISIQEYNPLRIHCISNKSFGVIKEYRLNKYLNVCSEALNNYKEGVAEKSEWIISKLN